VFYGCRSRGHRSRYCRGSSSYYGSRSSRGDVEGPLTSAKGKPSNCAGEGAVATVERRQGFYCISNIIGGSINSKIRSRPTSAAGSIIEVDRTRGGDRLKRQCRRKSTVAVDEELPKPNTSKITFISVPLKVKPCLQDCLQRRKRPVLPYGRIVISIPTVVAAVSVIPESTGDKSAAVGASPNRRSVRKHQRLK